MDTFLYYIARSVVYVHMLLIFSGFVVLPFRWCCCATYSTDNSSQKEKHSGFVLLGDESNFETINALACKLGLIY